MVRGNPGKLQPVRSKQEARERGAKGGVASGRARREKASLRAALEVLLERKGDDGKTGREALAVALYEQALKGDVRAFAELRDTVGEKPVQKAENEVSGGLDLHHELTPVVAGLLDQLGKGGAA